MKQKAIIVTMTGIAILIPSSIGIFITDSVWYAIPLCIGAMTTLLGSGAWTIAANPIRI